MNFIYVVIQLSLTGLGSGFVEPAALEPQEIMVI